MNPADKSQCASANNKVSQVTLQEDLESEDSRSETWKYVTSVKKSKEKPKKNLPNKGEIMGGRVSTRWDDRLVARCYSRRSDK